MKRHLLIVLALIATSCSLIYDDLSVCGVDYDLTYEMRLVAEVDVVIDEKLSSLEDAPVAAALRQWLEPTFSGFAHDLDMRFYSKDEEDIIRHSWHEIVDAKHATYTLYIPREDYTHVAVVNTEDNVNVSLVGETHSSTMALYQKEMDTLPSYNTAIYTARKTMLMSDTTVLSYYVHLYMATCAVALVVDQDSSELADMNVLLSGTASGFNISDSVFTFAHPALIRAEQISRRCYAVIALPSQGGTPSLLPAYNPAQRNASSLWQLRAYTPLQDGTITETLLNIDSPLRAGTLEIIRVKQHKDGSLEPVANGDVGVSVTLDWSDGGTHVIDL